MKLRHTVVLLFVGLLLFVAGMTAKTAEPREKADYKIFRISPRQLAVVCTDGADPTVYPKPRGEDALIISCGSAQ